MKGRRETGVPWRRDTYLLSPEERQPLPPLCDRGLQDNMRKLLWLFSWESADSVCVEARARVGSCSRGSRGCFGQGCSPAAWQPCEGRCWGSELGKALPGLLLRALECLGVLFGVQVRWSVPQLSSVVFCLQYKLCKVRKIFVGTKGIPHLVTHDARTIRYPDPLIKVNDTVQIDLETGKITDFIKFDTGRSCIPC